MENSLIVDPDAFRKEKKLRILVIPAVGSGKIEIHTHEDQTIKGIFQLVCSRVMAPEHLRLIYMGKGLKDILTLKELQVKDGATFGLIIATTGGGSEYRGIRIGDVENTDGVEIETKNPGRPIMLDQNTRTLPEALNVEIDTSLGPDVLRVKPIDGWKMDRVVRKDLTRYPYATLPDKIELGKIAPLEVVARLTPNGNNKARLDLTASEGQTEVSVLVTIECDPREYLEILGNYYAELSIPVKNEESKPLIFRLRAMKPGRCKVKVDFYQDTFLDRLSLDTDIVEKSVETHHYLTNEKSVELVLPRMTKPPDLCMIIYQIADYPNFQYEILLRADSLEHPFLRSGPKKLKGNPEQEFRAFFMDIESGIKKGRLRPDEVEDAMASRGKVLYKKLIPDNIQDIIWENRDRIRSIQVISDEPWIPWEMLKPSKGSEEDKFFCEKYAFSRWKDGVKTKSRSSFGMLKLIVPDNTNLKGALAESKWLDGFSKIAGYAVSHASTYQEVMSTLRLGGYDIIHFSTHGVYDKESALLSRLILDGDSYISPETILANSAFGDDNPLIILNACQTAQQGFSLTDIGGWASSFLESNAAAFIGTMWSVSDSTAVRFSTALYERFAIGLQIDEAVKQARNAARRLGDPSWLAYTLYSKPNLKMKLGSELNSSILAHYAKEGRLETMCKKCAGEISILEVDYCKKCGAPVDPLRKTAS